MIRFLALLAVCSVAFGQAWPNHAATDADLLRASNGAVTTLAAAMANTDMTLTVTDASHFVANSMVVVDPNLSTQENVQICAVSTGTLTVCGGGRGMEGTTARPHASGAAVIGAVTHTYNNKIVDELEAIEGNGGLRYLAPGTGGYSRHVTDVLSDRVSLANYCSVVTADFASCIQNALAVSYGKELFVPAGNYPVGSDVTIGTNGVDANIRIFCERGATFSPLSGGTTANVFEIVGNAIEIAGCGFSGSTGTATNGITIQGGSYQVTDVSIHGCKFTNIQYSTFQLFYASGIVFRDNKVDTPTTMAGGSVLFANDTGAKGYSDIHILDNTFREHTTQAIETIAMHSQYCGSPCVSNIEVAGNRIYKTGSNYGIEIQNTINSSATLITAVNIHDNYQKYMGTGATYNGFISIVGVNYSRVTFNTEDKNGNWIGFAFIELAETSSYNLVSGNVSLGTASSYSNAISLNCADHTIVSNNTFYNSGIYMGSSDGTFPNCDENTFDGNKIYNADIYVQRNAAGVHINHNAFLNNWIYGQGSTTDNAPLSFHGTSIDGNIVQGNHFFNALNGIASYDSTNTRTCGNYFDSSIGNAYLNTASNNIVQSCDVGQPWTMLEPATHLAPESFQSGVTSSAITSGQYSGPLPPPVLGTLSTVGPAGSGASYDALPAGTYSFCVSAVVSSGETACSNTQSVTLSSDGGVSGSWSAVPGATAYHWWYAGANYYYGLTGTSITIHQSGYTGASYTSPTVGTATGGPSQMPALRITNSHTPSTSTDACGVGQLAWDGGYLYVCVATNQWVRTATYTF